MSKTSIRQLTLKQLKTIEALPKVNYDMGKAMLKGGYTLASSKAGTNYRRLRRVTNQIDAFNPEKIKARIMDAYELAKKKEDLTNLNRNIEFQGKVAGMITDKVEQKGEVAKVVIAYSQPKINEYIPNNQPQSDTSQPI